jgi:hypothetical protein
MNTSPVVIVSPKKQTKTPPPPIAPEGIDAVTPFLRATVAGSVAASWCAGVLSGLAWKLLRPFIVALVTAGGFVFGVCLWVCAVCGVLALVGWITRKD